MRRLMTIVTALTLIFGLVACGFEQEEIAPKEGPQEIAAESEPSDVLAQDSIMIYKDVSQMLAPCTQLAAYMAVSNIEVDMKNPVADDFWLIMSLVTYAADPALIGEFGTIDLKEAQIKDIAETFFSDMLKQTEIPSPNGTYSAAYIFAEGLYELQPISISDMVSEMVSLEEVDSENGRYLMKIKLIDEQQRTDKLEWSISLDDWEDKEDHLFPYKFVKAWHTN